MRLKMGAEFAATLNMGLNLSRVLYIIINKSSENGLRLMLSITK